MKHEGLFWCCERKEYFRWDDFINYYKTKESDMIIETNFISKKHHEKFLKYVTREILDGVKSGLLYNEDYEYGGGMTDDEMQEIVETVLGLERTVASNSILEHLQSHLDLDMIYDEIRQYIREQRKLNGWYEMKKAYSSSSETKH
tara:strand:- start:360 stop:794 length:435 start_codon:yes stop_codon:yes gene_type:complete